MKYRLFLCTTAAFFWGSTSFANTNSALESSSDLTWIGSIAVGPMWSRSGESQDFFLAPEIEKMYVARKSTNALASGELFVGLQKTLSTSWLGQWGLTVATTGNTKLHGVIWDDADPQFDNYSYQYKVRNTRVSIKGKLLLDKGYWAMPWVSSSIGIGFNRAHYFTNTPLIFEALPQNNFTNQTKKSLNYTLGVGLQKTVSKHWQLGVGYEFVDWGRSSLSRAKEQTMNSGLVLNHIYTNGVLLNLTYLS